MASLIEQGLFSLTAIIVNIDIALSARIEHGVKQLLALVTKNGELVLHYIYGELKPVARRVPWFDDPSKAIQCVCFDPTATWLLVLAFDSSLYIVPALKMLDPVQKIDCKWSVLDLTYFPKTVRSPSAQPRCVIWWQTLDCNQNAIIGYSNGQISFVSLTDGQIIGITSIGENLPIISLNICLDNSLDSITLLITSENRQQWKMLLEQRSTSYIWTPEDSGSSKTSLAASLWPKSLSDNKLSNELSSSSSKSRLQGFKQLSVDTLTSIKQKFGDSRNALKSRQALRKEADFHGHLDGSNINFFCDQQVDIVRFPEKLTNLGETFLRPQYAKNRHLFSGYFDPANILTIHGVDVDNNIPLYVHKLHGTCRDILVTDRFFYVVDGESSSLSIISCPLSESRLDGDNEFNPDALVASFDLPHDNEAIVALYKLTDLTSCFQANSNSNTSNRNNPSGHSDRFSTVEDVKLFHLPKNIRDLDVKNPKIDTCILVTNCAVYKVMLRCSIIEVFMQLVCQEHNIEKAEQLAFIFGLNLQQLLEYAGDLMLSSNEFVRATTLYKLSRCRLLKSVLKFAVAGNANELLLYIQTCLSTSNLDMSLPTKIHLSNLAVMAFTEIYLRRNTNKCKHRVQHYYRFVEFLSKNEFYDQILAINVLCQTALWSFLSVLIQTRGLVYDVLETVLQMVKSTIILTCSNNRDNNDDDNNPSQNSPTSTNPHNKQQIQLIDMDDIALHRCISEPINIQCILIKPNISKLFLAFVRAKLDIFDPLILQRLAHLLDPSQPIIRPILDKIYNIQKIKQQKEANTNLDVMENEMSSTSDSTSHPINANGILNHDDQQQQQQLVIFKDIIETFILVLLTRINRMHKKTMFDKTLLKRICPEKSTEQNKNVIEKFIIEPRNDRILSAGYSHVGLLRNNSIWTWGNCSNGALGNGPVMSKYQLPMPVETLNSLCNANILSISCGRTHTLVLSEFGVYAFGLNTYGQLGLGEMIKTSYPMFVEALTNERVVDVCAGQYHSVALTATGHLYTWGWGVHGQLGHGDVEDCRFPRRVSFFSKIIIQQIAAGHAHTLVLTSSGVIYAFGSSSFGQLGYGSTNKSNIPVRVQLYEKIILINTQYFQNFALGVTNKLYTWGASPQVLRLAAQAQKKAKMMQMSLNNNYSGVGGDATAGIPLPLNEIETVPDEITSSLDSCGATSDLNTSTTSSNSTETTETCDDLNNARIKIGDNGEDCDGNGEERSQSRRQPTPNHTQQLQSHLRPRLVNTNNVNGVIVNVFSGCHHAALVTNDGTLYTWGKNLDGQLGTGNRKEVLIPTVLKINPINLVTDINSPITQNDADLQELRCSDVACGAEFTVVVDSIGRVLAWGNNSSAQLGKMPNEDQKGLEGKMVFLRTTKRFIKLPNSIQNICDTPKEIASIPSQSISYGPNHSSPRQRHCLSECDNGEYTEENDGVMFNNKTCSYEKCIRNAKRNFHRLNQIVESEKIVYYNEHSKREKPELEKKNDSIQKNIYGSKTLHYTLETYLGFYDTDKIIYQCLNSENFQAASKISYLKCFFVDSLGYQLQSLQLLIDQFYYPKNVKTESVEAVTIEINKEKDVIVVDSINTSQSLDSIKHFGDEIESQGGCEQMCENNDVSSKVLSPHEELDDNETDFLEDDSDKDIDESSSEDKHSSYVRERILKYVSTIEKSTLNNDRILLQSINCDLEHSKDFKRKYRIKPQAGSSEINKNDENISDERNILVTESTLINYTTDVLMFYIESTQNTDNHILMQNILIKSMNFWFSNHLPVDILEDILLKNMAKFFYPLSILLFCKNFNNNLGEIITTNNEENNMEATDSNNSYVFLDQLSTKFCLQLCSMVLQNAKEGKKLNLNDTNCNDNGICKDVVEYIAAGNPENIN